MDAKKRLLLVDDDADFVETNRAVLEENGYDVIVAYNGRECLDQVKKSKPDLILLDIMMTTVGDGMFVAQDLRRNDATQDIPIIVITSLNQVSPYNMGPDDAWMPVDAFLQKPVVPEVLLETVKKGLGQPTRHIEHRTV